MAALQAPSRTVVMTVPLVRNGQALNEVVVQVAPDGSLSIEAQSLRRELGGLLNELGSQRLAEVISGNAFVSLPQLETAGFRLTFNSARLELMIAMIDPTLRPVERISGRDEGQENLLPSIGPAGFSAYMNVNMNLLYREPEGVVPPDLFLFGAARSNNIVVEFDGGFTEQFGGNYQFFRRGVRAVYDEPESQRRWSAGDLRLQAGGFLRSPVIGGVAVEKSRRIFDPFSPITNFGGRQIFIDSPSTVEVLVNGSPHRTLELQPGTYSLEDLPLQFGSNDIQLRIRDAAGREQVTRFGYFYDPIDLRAGEDEYVASLGFLSRDLGFQPSYTGDLAFIANYRRAFSDSLVVGGGIQLSEDVQVLATELRFVPQTIPGAFDVQAATSIASRVGFAIRAAYRVALNRGGRLRQLNISADYQSDNFQTLANLGQFSIASIGVNVSYNHEVNDRTFLTTGLAYFDSPQQPSQSTLFADVTYRVRDNMRLTAGFEYGSDSTLGSKFGVRVGLTVLFDNRHRLEANYQSRQDYGRATFSRDRDINVGSYGYAATVQRAGDEMTVDGRLDYLANRFDLRATVATQGRSLGNLTQEQTARLQIGTSFAFAGGTFGIGRPINESFLLARPHRTLRGADVIVGRGLELGRHEASSGTFGAAVIGRLSAYRPQDVQYDVEGAQAGYDIGEGVVRLHPAYRSGYALVVGTDRFVSALGTLRFANAPASLVTGTIASTDDGGFETQPFFTNSVGRFAISGLAPGKTYRVRLGDGRGFDIQVPADSSGLYRLDTVELPERGE